MKSYQVLGYTADADCYCEECANKCFGPFPYANFEGATYDTKGFKDREGNEIHPIFADSEWDYQPTCGLCGRELEATVIRAR